MGWVFTQNATKSEVIHQLCDRQTWIRTDGNTIAGREAIRKHVVGDALYAVMRKFHFAEGKEVEDGRFLLVAALAYQKDYGWGYKDMDESMHPYYYHCPMSYFDLVGPPPNEDAARWREKCKEVYSKKTRKVRVGEFWSLPNCKPNIVRIVSESPLIGMDMNGQKFRISKSLLGEKMRFPLGRTVITPGAEEAIERNGESPLTFLSRHASGDWGVVDDEDKEANDQSLLDGTRVLSAYVMRDGEKIWIITEGDRSCTTILLPSEY